MVDTDDARSTPCATLRRSRVPARSGERAGWARPSLGWLPLLWALLVLHLSASAQEAPKPPASLASLARLLNGKTGPVVGHPTRFRPASKPVLLYEMADTLGRDAEQREVLREVMVQGAKAVEEQLAAAGHPNDVAAALAFALVTNWSVWKDVEVPDAASEALLAQLHSALDTADFRKLADLDKQKAYEHCVGLGVFTAVMKEAADGDAQTLDGIRTFSRQVLQSLLGSSPDALELTVAGLRAAAGKPQQAPPENGAAPAAARDYTYHTTNFTEGWVGTLQEDHVQLTKGDLQVLLTFVERFDMSEFSGTGKELRHHYWQTVVSKFFATGETQFERGGALSDFSEDFIEGPAQDRRTGARRHVAMIVRVVAFTGTLSLVIASAPDRDSLWRQFPKANRKYDNDLLPMYGFNKFAVGPKDLLGAWVSGNNGKTMNWYSTTTGENVGATAATSSDRFVFADDGTYTSTHKGATGVIGALNTFQQEYRGQYTLTGWSLTATKRWQGKTEQFDAWFEAVRGGRVLHLENASLRMELGRELGVAGAAAPALGTVEVVRQWASGARASSEYGADDWSASRATGAPDVPAHSDDARAWASQRPNGGEEWLEVTFARAVFATGVRVVQSQFPGAIVRIDATLADGNTVTVWSGPDKTVYEAGRIGVLEGTFAATKTPVARLKIVLDTRLVSGWNEIDAVELLGTAASGGGSGK